MEDEILDIQMKVDYSESDTIPGSYANSIHVQENEYEIELSFFLAMIPDISGEYEKDKEMLENIYALKSKCISKILVNKIFIPKIIECCRKYMRKLRKVKKKPKMPRKFGRRKVKRKSLKKIEKQIRRMSNEMIALMDEISPGFAAWYRENYDESGKFVDE